MVLRSVIVDRRDLVLLADTCKESQISKSISVQSEFISDPFSWKRTGPVKGMEWKK